MIPVAQALGTLAAMMAPERGTEEKKRGTETIEETLRRLIAKA